MWSSRTLYRRQNRLATNSYVFDRTFQCQVTRSSVTDDGISWQFELWKILHILVFFILEPSVNDSIIQPIVESKDDSTQIPM